MALWSPKVAGVENERYILKVVFSKSHFETSGLVMLKYKVGSLNPHKSENATKQNGALLQEGAFGIGVIQDDLARRCIYNIVSHTPYFSLGMPGCDEGYRAIEIAATVELPKEGTMLVTSSENIDTVGAMAVLDLRMQSRELSQLPQAELGRIKDVANSLRFQSGRWPGKTPLPRAACKWPVGLGYPQCRKDIAPVSMMVTDPTVRLELRVAAFQNWLVDGKTPLKYSAAASQRRSEIIAEIETSRTTISLNEGGQIATVVSKNPNALILGYSLAPVVVAYNSAHVIQGGMAHKKFTVAAFNSAYLDTESACADLKSAEPGWGGRNYIGSPQGLDSELSLDEVVEIVSRHHKKV
jgi:hypothetical protein